MHDPMTTRPISDYRPQHDEDCASRQDTVARHGVGSFTPTDCTCGLYDALRAEAWRPMDTIPASVTRALFVWPAYKLDENCDLTTERVGEIVATGYRTGKQAWEPSDEVNAVGHAFDDDFEYGDPIAWRALPSPPKDQP